MILTFPGNFDPLVNVGSMSIEPTNSSLLSSETESSVSHPSKYSGGEPDDLNMPAAAACVSVGELRAADGLLGPLEFLAIRMCEGFTDMEMEADRRPKVCLMNVLHNMEDDCQ